jgi:hypothetical protein
MPTLEEGLQEKKWRVPVTSLLTGEISEWVKGDGDWVNEGDVVCIIKPWGIVVSEELPKVRAPASGRLAIEKRFAEPKTPVQGGLFEEDRDIIAYVYTEGFPI